MTHVKFTTESGKVVAFPRALIVLDEIGENEPCYIATVSDKAFPKVLSKAEYDRLLALLTTPEPEQERARVCEWESDYNGLRVCWIPGCVPMVAALEDGPGGAHCPYCGGRVKKGGEG